MPAHRLPGQCLRTWHWVSGRRLRSQSASPGSRTDSPLSRTRGTRSWHTREKSCVCMLLAGMPELRELLHLKQPSQFATAMLLLCLTCCCLCMMCVRMHTRTNHITPTHRLGKGSSRRRGHHDQAVFATVSLLCCVHQRMAGSCVALSRFCPAWLRLRCSRACGRVRAAGGLIRARYCLSPRTVFVPWTRVWATALATVGFWPQPPRTDWVAHASKCTA
jgi:hypothetical protein